MGGCWVVNGVLHAHCPLLSDIACGKKAYTVTHSPYLLQIQHKIKTIHTSGCHAE
jgi:hypothetical protein